MPSRRRQSFARKGQAVSFDQQHEAAVLANAKRLARAQLRRDLRAGLTDWREVLLDPPECLHGMLLSEILLMFPKVGRTTVERLGREGIGECVVLTVRVERASLRSRRWLVDRVHSVPSEMAA